MTWIKCSERMPPMRYIPAAGLTSSRRATDPVLWLAWDGDECHAYTARYGVKEDEDWGRVAAGVGFWCDSIDLICTMEDEDRPQYWYDGPLPPPPEVTP